MPHEPKRILLVCGEPSGDLHASELVRELRKLESVEVVAAGGPRLQAAGARVRWNSTNWGAIGVPQALAKLPLYLRVMRELVAEAVARPYDLVVLVDFGAFNLRFAARLRRLRRALPVFYYFPPSSWMRRRRRWDRLLDVTDYIATPFAWNAAALAAQGATVRWVGHPAVDRIQAVDRARARAELGLEPDQPAVALLPGSRALERNLLGPVFLDAAALMRRRLPSLTVLWSPPPAGVLSEAVERRAARAGVVTVADSAAMLRAADAAMACFGTVTLEAALAGCPLVAAYRGTLAMWLNYVLVSLPTRYYAMPNIILGRELVPELSGTAATAPRLADACLRVLTDAAARQTMLQGYAAVRRQLGPPGAARRAAEMLLEALEGKLRPHRRPIG